MAHPDNLVCGRCHGPLTWKPNMKGQFGRREQQHVGDQPSCAACEARGLPLARPVTAPPEPTT